MAVLCDFTLRPSLEPPPPTPPSNRRSCFHLFARLSHLLFSLSLPPFSILFQLHFTFIASIFYHDPVSFFVLIHNRALYLSLVTCTIYLTYLTLVSPRKPFIFHFTWISLFQMGHSLTVTRFPPCATLATLSLCLGELLCLCVYSPCLFATLRNPELAAPPPILGETETQTQSQVLQQALQKPRTKTSGR